MGKIIFVLGGARSGKSSYAVELAKKCPVSRVAFIATCEALDEEMKKRIALHKKKRPRGWKTFEEPRAVLPALKKVGKRYDLIVLDCLTLFVSNMIHDGHNGREIEKAASAVCAALKKSRSDSIVVSNEVGLGIVPDSALGRVFRDIAGRVNQIIAKAADEVIFMVSGMPWKVK